ncbi:MAG: homing endonuclease associated repeat-containing protein [Aristaeellaceae bacterium]
MSAEKKEWATEQLRQKYAALGRLPHKDDFDEVTRARIKAFLGPWPRALEAAGLKAPRPTLPRAKKRRKAPSSS